MARQRFHVGEYIRDELEARGWSSRELAQRMGGDVDVNHCTIELTLAAAESPESEPITAATLGRETAEGLARAFGSSVEVWLNLDAAYHSAN